MYLVLYWQTHKKQACYEKVDTPLVSLEIRLGLPRALSLLGGGERGLNSTIHTGSLRRGGCRGLRPPKVYLSLLRVGRLFTVFSVAVHNVFFWVCEGTYTV